MSSFTQEEQLSDIEDVVITDIVVIVSYYSITHNKKSIP